MKLKVQVAVPLNLKSTQGPAHSTNTQADYIATWNGCCIIWRHLSDRRGLIYLTSYYSLAS